MAGNIWGEGPRGGIFGARIDPQPQPPPVDREAQVLAQLQAEQPGFEDRIAQWWGSLPPPERQRYIRALDERASE
jgi:hypothetical protein